MRHKILILVCFLLALVSCTREETPGGALRIEFETGALQTRSDAPDGIVAEGGGIFIDNGTPDLVILLADSSQSHIRARSERMRYTEDPDIFSRGQPLKNDHS